MLYKKYHRNLVKQFKRGFRFSPTSDGGWDFYIGKSCEVICNPIIYAITESRTKRRGFVIVTKVVVVSVEDDKRERRITLTLINPKGKLINYVSKD